jgi:hypothetical protein
MSVSINENSYIPDYNSFDVFGKYKLPFILLLIIIIIAFVLLFSIFNRDNLNSDNTRLPILVLEIVLFFIFVFVVVLNYKWLNDHNYSFTTEIKNLFNDKVTQIDVKSEGDEIPVKEVKEEKKCENKKDDGEVFHIPRNKYSYNDAMDVCKRLNSRLATYDEVEDAYKNGANWCSYGWSDDQLALFPIQKSVYNDLKKINGHEHDCGRPGVNGGYISNKSSKFGINCYGKKPYITDKDKDFMDRYSYSPAISDASYNNMEKVTDLLVAPFNKEKWSFE